MIKQDLRVQHYQRIAKDDGDQIPAAIGCAEDFGSM
jgi:hypothetical protein